MIKVAVEYIIRFWYNSTYIIRGSPSRNFRLKVGDGEWVSRKIERTSFYKHTLEKTSLSQYLLESGGLSRISLYFADEFEIKRAYKRLALQFHPDKVCTQCNIVNLIMAVLSFCCSSSFFWCFKVTFISSV